MHRSHIWMIHVYFDFILYNGMIIVTKLNHLHMYMFVLQDFFLPRL